MKCARVSSGAEKLTKTMQHFAQEHKIEIVFCSAVSAKSKTNGHFCSFLQTNVKYT